MMSKKREIFGAGFRLAVILAIFAGAAPSYSKEAQACEGTDTPEARIEFVRTVGRELYAYLKRGENDVLALQRWFLEGGRAAKSSCEVKSVRNFCSVLESLIPSLVGDYRLAFALAFRALDKGYDYSKLEKIGNPWLSSAPYLPERASAIAPLSEVERRIIDDELLRAWDSQADLSLGNLDAEDWIAPSGLIEKFIHDSEVLASRFPRDQVVGPRESILAVTARLKKTRELTTARERVDAAMRIYDDRWNRFRESVASRVNQKASLQVWSAVDSFRPLVYFESQITTKEAIVAALEKTLVDNRSVQSELIAQMTKLKGLMDRVRAMGGMGLANSQQEEEIEQIEYWFVDRASFASEVISEHPHLCRAGQGLMESYARKNLIALGVSGVLLFSPYFRLLPRFPIGGRALLAASTIAGAQLSLQAIRDYGQARRDFTARWIPDGRFSLLTETPTVQSLKESASTAPLLFLLSFGVPKSGSSRVATFVK